NDDLTEVTFVDLTYNGVALNTDELKPGVQTLGNVAGVDFITASLYLFSPDAGTDTVNSQVGLQGNLDFGKQGLIGLKVAVNSFNNYVLIDKTGVSLTGVDASLSASFKTGGVDIEGNLGVSYTVSGNVFSFFGAMKFSTQDDGMHEVEATLGVTGDPGLVV